jgi:hypothetical protein
MVSSRRGLGRSRSSECVGLERFYTPARNGNDDAGVVVYGPSISNDMPSDALARNPHPVATLRLQALEMAGQAL